MSELQRRKALLALTRVDLIDRVIELEQDLERINHVYEGWEQ